MSLQQQKQAKPQREEDAYPSESRLYHFPDIKQLGQQFDNVLEINHKLDILLKNHNLMNDKNKIEKTLVTRETEGGYWFKCKVRGCQAFLKFHYTGNGKLVLARSDIEHEHKVSVRMTKGKLPKIRNSEVEECYDQLQLLNFRPGEIVNFIRTRFKISKPHFYAIKYGRNKRETIKNLLMALSKYDHFFFECKDLQELAAYYRNQRLKPERRQDKDVVIVVSRKMKQLYENYHGEYVLFSIFPELVLETRYSRKANYHHVGVLYGQDSTGSVNLLFGVVFMRKSIRLAYLYIMEKLFNFLGRYPKVLITDYDQHLAQAIRRLQKKTASQQNSVKFHLQLPNSFIINSFQSRTSPQFLSILSNDLEGLLRESDRNKHEQRLKVILRAVEHNHPSMQDRIAELIRKFVKGNSIIYLPPLFVGLSVTPYSSANHLRSRVLDFFKSPRPMVLATKAIFEIFQAYPVLKFLSKEQIEGRLNPPKQCSSKREKLQLLGIVSKNYQSSTRMKSVSKSLSQSAALCFHDSLQKCFTGQLQLIQSGNHISYKAVESAENYPYVVHHVYENRGCERVALWRCNCFYYAKLGLPCWHEIKACIEERCSLIPQINPFWLKESKLAVHKKGGDAVEHDVKYWNEDGPKFCQEERFKEKIEQSNNNLSGSQVSQNAQLFNIKINQNPSQMGDDDDDCYSEGKNESKHAGLNDLINELNDLGGISIKQNDQYEQNGPDEWNDAFSNHFSDKNSEHNRLYEQDDQNLNFDDQSLQSALSNHKNSKQGQKIQAPEASNLKALKANNHSGPSKQYSDDFDQLDLNLDFGDDKDEQSQFFPSQSSKIGDYESNFDVNFSEFGDGRAFSYKSNHGRGVPKQEVVIDDDEEEEVAEGNFMEEDFYQNEVNSQQDSGEEWERTSFDKIDVRPPRKDQKRYEDEDQQFDFALGEDETQKYVPFGRDDHMDIDDD